MVGLILVVVLFTQLINFEKEGSNTRKNDVTCLEKKRTQKAVIVI